MSEHSPLNFSCFIIHLESLADIVFDSYPCSGNFGEHCEGCELDDDHHTMRCQCQDGTSKSGKAESYYINTGKQLFPITLPHITSLPNKHIDTLIRNDAGYLACYGHVGTKCQGDKAAAAHAVAFNA